MTEDRISIRTALLPGDVEAVARMHGELYAIEFGWNEDFERYVRTPLTEFAARDDARERIWLAVADASIVGCVGIVATQEPGTLQLRWFLVHPAMRGRGLGATLLSEAIAFCRAQGAQRVILWTVAGLDAAAHLYAKAGFELAQQRESPGWGIAVLEQLYTLAL